MSVMLILGFPTCFGSRLKENGACRFVAQLSCLGGLEAVPSKQLRALTKESERYNWLLNLIVLHAGEQMVIFLQDLSGANLRPRDQDVQIMYSKSLLACSNHFPALFGNMWFRSLEPVQHGEMTTPFCSLRRQTSVGLRPPERPGTTRSMCSRDRNEVGGGWRSSRRFWEIAGLERETFISSVMSKTFSTGNIGGSTWEDVALKAV